jgi:hypothetical protein
MVCHGHLPERAIMTGIGAVDVRCHGGATGSAAPMIASASPFGDPAALCARSKSLEVLIPRSSVKVATKRAKSTWPW